MKQMLQNTKIWLQFGLLKFDLFTCNRFYDEKKPMMRISLSKIKAYFFQTIKISKVVKKVLKKLIFAMSNVNDKIYFLDFSWKYNSRWKCQMCLCSRNFSKQLFKVSYSEILRICRRLLHRNNFVWLKKLCIELFFQ